MDMKIDSDDAIAASCGAAAKETTGAAVGISTRSLQRCPKVTFCRRWSRSLDYLGK